MEQPPTVTESTGTLSLGPRSIERKADAGWTLVGGIDDPTPARVDGGGLVAPNGADWLVDWWIGADDRWYLPAREPSVRQRRLGAGPVIETSVRIPGGDAVATAYPVLAGGRRATAVEIRNDSPVPVVLAIAIRPLLIGGDLARPARSVRLELVDHTTVTVDGDPAVLLPRPPNHAGAGTDRDLVDDVQAGGPLEWLAPVAGPVANAVCLYPLPHDTSLRLTVLTGDSGDAPAGLRPENLPPPGTVARGWTSVVERASTHRFPDPGITALADAARARLLLAAPALPDGVAALDIGAAQILEALAIGGHVEECRPALDALAAAFPTRLPSDAHGAVAVLGAAATGAELLGPEAADALLASTTQLAHLIDRRGNPADTSVAKAALARLAVRAGQPDAARHLLATAGPAVEPSRPDPLDRVTELAQLATPAGGWPPHDDVRAAARFWKMAAGLLLWRDHTEPDPGRVSIQLLPSMPVAWMGGEVEVHRAPLAGSRISFAVRWHGYRPALLWEVEPVDGRPSEPPRLTCPGLDPEWVADRSSGEALLAGSANELPPAPGPGDSFA